MLLTPTHLEKYMIETLLGSALLASIFTGTALFVRRCLKKHRYVEFVLWLFSMPCYLLSLYLIIHILLPVPNNVRITLSPGVQYERDSWQGNTTQARIHTIAMDIERVRFGVSLAGYEENGIPAMKTSDALRLHKADLAINGSFFFPFRDNHVLDYYPHSGDAVMPVGQTVIHGRLYGDHETAWPKLVVDREGHMEILEGALSDNLVTSKNIEMGISGKRLLVKNSRPNVKDDSYAYPRTVVGLGNGGKTLWLMVVDGKQTGYSEGISLNELAIYLVAKGVENAIELDGGGSSTMVWAKTGVLNRPSHTKIPRRERPVANHVLVWFNT